MSVNSRKSRNYKLVFYLGNNLGIGETIIAYHSVFYLPQYLDRRNNNHK